MTNMEQVAESIYRLDTPVQGIETVFTVYLIKAEKGVLLEPGPATAIPSILEGMKQLGMRQLAYIIPTHIHIDHAGAVGKLAELFPQARVVLHPQGVKHVIDPSRLIQSTKMAFGDDFEACYGPILPVPESRIKVPADGEVLSFGGGEVRVIYAPGHAPHHMAVFDRRTGGLFCGEALGVPRFGAASFPLPAVAPPGFDMEVYLETMEALRRLSPRVLFYSHDGVGREPDSLIRTAEENTRVFGDIILKALRTGDSGEVIIQRIQEYLAGRGHLRAEDLGLKMIVNGYTVYFKKKGLV